MRIVLLGTSHRTAPLELRERLAVDDPTPALRKLVAGDEVDEAVLFSTCNRVEVVAVTRSLESARLRLRSLFARDLGGAAEIPSAADLDSHLYEHLDGDAARAGGWAPSPLVAGYMHVGCAVMAIGCLGSAYVYKRVWEAETAAAREQ